jgi:hypothetical protein
MQEQSNIAAATLNDVLSLRNEGDNKQLIEISKRIKYQSFYFCGGEPTLITNLSGRYDPREFTDYIALAKQNGYHKHFLYLTDTGLKSISFADCDVMFTPYIDKSTGKLLEQNNNIITILAGMYFFDKTSSFISEYAKWTIINEKTIPTILNDSIMNSVTTLSRKFNTTRKEFVKNNYGILYTDAPFCSNEELEDYANAQAKIKIFETQLYEILKNAGMLNICVNSTNIGSVGSGAVIDIDQTSSCLMNSMGATVATETKSKPATETKPNAVETKSKIILIYIIICIVICVIVGIYYFRNRLQMSQSVLAQSPQKATLYDI